MTRLQRRILVVLFGGSVVLFSEILDSSLAPTFHAVAVVLSILLFALLLYVTKALAFKSVSKLDERQLQVSLKAQQRGLGFATTLIVLSLLRLLVKTRSFGPNMSVSVPVSDVVLWLYLLLALSTCVIAWTEPDPLTEDAFEERTLA